MKFRNQLTLLLTMPEDAVGELEISVERKGELLGKKTIELDNSSAWQYVKENDVFDENKENDVFDENIAGSHSRFRFDERHFLMENDNKELMELEEGDVLTIRRTDKKAGAKCYGYADYKGIAGVLGENSKLHDLWLEHFECGIWVGDYVEADKMKYTDELTVSNSRIRNNFADGVNFAQGTRNSKVQNSNVRGNGDDGLAIWSSSKWDKEKNKDYLNKY